MSNFQSLEQAIDEDAYEYLSQHAPSYIKAIDNELVRGATPEQIRWYVQVRVGADRLPLALRCEQAARHIERRNTLT